MLTGVEEPEEGPSAPTQKLTRVDPTPAPSTLASYEVSPIATPTGQASKTPLVALEWGLTDNHLPIFVAEKD